MRAPSTKRRPGCVSLSSRLFMAPLEAGPPTLRGIARATAPRLRKERHTSIHSSSGIHLFTMDWIRSQQAKKAAEARAGLIAEREAAAKGESSSIRIWSERDAIQIRPRCRKSPRSPTPTNPSRRLYNSQLSHCRRGWLRCRSQGSCGESSFPVVPRRSVRPRSFIVARQYARLRLYWPALCRLTHR